MDPFLLKSFDSVANAKNPSSIFSPKEGKVAQLYLKDDINGEGYFLQQIRLFRATKRKLMDL